MRPHLVAIPHRHLLLTLRRLLLRLLRLLPVGVARGVRQHRQLWMLLLRELVLGTILLQLQGHTESLRRRQPATGRTMGLGMLIS